MRDPAFCLDRRQALIGLGLLSSALPLSELLASARARAAELQTDPRWRFLAACGDSLIPPSDTPGGGTPDAIAFAILALDNHLAGLDPEAVPLVQSELDKRALTDFARLSLYSRGQTIAQLDAEAFSRDADAGSVAWGWRNVKRALLMGYYTSEVGASQELTYDPVPGSFTLVRVDSGFRDFSNGGGPL